MKINRLCNVRLSYTKQANTYQSLVECNLGHRILCPKLWFFVSNVISHSVVHHSIILVYACSQLKLQKCEFLVDLEKCIIEQLLMSCCKPGYEISDWRLVTRQLAKWIRSLQPIDYIWFSEVASQASSFELKMTLRQVQEGVPGSLSETAAKTAWKSGSARGPRERSACSRVWWRWRQGKGAMLRLLPLAWKIAQH